MIEKSPGHQGGNETGTESDSDPSEPCPTLHSVNAASNRKKHLFDWSNRTNFYTAIDGYPQPCSHHQLIYEHQS